MVNLKYFPGDFYACFDENRNCYKIYRMLLAVSSSVHIAIYSNEFPELPKEIDLSALHFNTSLFGEESIGIMHVPIAFEGFDNNNLHFIQHLPLDDEILSGLSYYLKEGEEENSEAVDNFIEQHIKFSQTRLQE